ncbi:MAG: PcfJ domain-containing protein, partial [Verrucomicrobia bacterium]|nr:PcfJ domain-containing protein [Verrucomicrobiota bacterium]
MNETAASLTTTPKQPACFRWGTAWKNGKFYRFDKTAVCVIRGWPELRAWRMTWKRRQWQPIRPAIRLREGWLAGCRAPRRVGRYWEPHASFDLDAPEPQAASAAPVELTGLDAWFARLAKMEREHALRFIATIPDESRKLAGSFASRQWHVLCLLARCPEASDLVRQNPALAFALASSWAFRPGLTHPWRSARVMSRRRQRDLARWLGWPDGEWPARVLRKVEPAWCAVPLLLDLRDAMRRKDERKWLLHLPAVNGPVVAILRNQRLAGRFSFHFLRELAAADAAVGVLLSDCFRMLRFVGERERTPCLRSVTDLQKWHDTLMEPLWKADVRKHGFSMDDPLPDPPLPGTDVIQPIRTVGDLAREGREQAHCVFALVGEVRARQRAIYKVLEPERATLSLTPT